MKGLSFQKGVMFFGKQYISISVQHKGQQYVYALHKTKTNMCKISWLLFQSLPAGYKAGLFLLGMLLVIRAAGGMSVAGWEMTGLPFYTLVLLFFGSHFIFPKEWRQYHGAEHKVFSYKGLKTIENVNGIAEAAITNRYCSTNVVIFYFAGFIIGTGFLWSLLDLSTAAAVSAWSNAAFTAAGYKWFLSSTNKWLNRLLRVSYWTQKHIACAEPAHKHLTAAVLAYQLLLKKERGYYGNY